jgi:DNA-binding transcriptional LysR family regulator
VDTPNLKQLKIIDALIECGNGTRAAAKLNVSAATISYTMGQLRKKHDQVLFTRNRGKLIPSAIALELQAQYQELTLLNSERKELIISTDAIIEFVLGQNMPIESNETDVCSMRFINMEATTEERLRKLRSRIVDIDIGGKLPDDSSITCAKFIESDICVVVNKNHSFIQDEMTREQWFQCGHTRWIRDNDTVTSMVEGLDFNDALFAHRVICYESMNLLSLAYICSRSEYIMLIPRAFVAPLSQFYQIKAVKPPEGVPMKFECFYHYHHSMHARVKSLSLSNMFTDR